jgi:hypothetical protein
MSFVPAPPDTSQPSTRRRHARRRGWVTYLRVAWLDYLCLAVVAGLTLVLYCTPMYFKDNRVVPLLPSIRPSNIAQPFQEFQLSMDISYPWVKEPLPTHGCALVVIFVPLLVIGAFQIKTWILWDFHAGVMGVLKAVVSTYVTVLSASIFRGPTLTNLATAGLSSVPSKSISSAASDLIISKHASQTGIPSWKVSITTYTVSMQRCVLGIRVM